MLFQDKFSKNLDNKTPINNFLPLLHRLYYISLPLFYSFYYFQFQTLLSFYLYIYF